MLGGGVLGAGMPGHVSEPGQDGVAELADQQPGGVRGDGGLAGVTGCMPGADQAAQCSLRLDRPDRAGVVLGRVLVVAD
jgi:hypothetical protein